MGSMSKKTILLISMIAVTFIVCIYSIVYINHQSKGNVLDQLETGETTLKAPAETTLTFYFVEEEPKAAREVLAQVEQKVRNKLNIKLDFKFVNNKFIEVIQKAIASGSGCDAFYYSDDAPKKN
jgi:ABC-type glycerol-3-phosphate transport system substrate-binding protein